MIDNFNIDNELKVIVENFLKNNNILNEKYDIEFDRENSKLNYKKILKYIDETLDLVDGNKNIGLFGKSIVKNDCPIISNCFINTFGKKGEKEYNLSMYYFMGFKIDQLDYDLDKEELIYVIRCEIYKTNPYLLKDGKMNTVKSFVFNDNVRLYDEKEYYRILKIIKKICDLYKYFLNNYENYNLEKF